MNSLLDAQIWPMIARGSHSFTCCPLTNHACLYSPAIGHHRPLAGTHCTYPWRVGQAELSWWLVIYWDRFSGTGSWTPDMVTHPSTNRAQHRLTSLIETNTLTTMPNHQLIPLFCRMSLWSFLDVYWKWLVWPYESVDCTGSECDKSGQ